MMVGVTLMRGYAIARVCGTDVVNNNAGIFIGMLVLIAVNLVSMVLVLVLVIKLLVLLVGILLLVVVILVLVVVIL